MCDICRTRSILTIKDFCTHLFNTHSTSEIISYKIKKHENKYSEQYANFTIKCNKCKTNLVVQLSKSLKNYTLNILIECYY